MVMGNPQNTFEGGTNERLSIDFARSILNGPFSPPLVPSPTITPFFNIRATETYPQSGSHFADSFDGLVTCPSQPAQPTSLTPSACRNRVAVNEQGVR